MEFIGQQRLEIQLARRMGLSHDWDWEHFWNHYQATSICDCVKWSRQTDSLRKRRVNLRLQFPPYQLLHRLLDWNPLEIWLVHCHWNWRREVWWTSKTQRRPRKMVQSWPERTQWKKTFIQTLHSFEMRYRSCSIRARLEVPWGHYASFQSWRPSI